MRSRTTGSKFAIADFFAADSASAALVHGDADCARITVPCVEFLNVLQVATHGFSTNPTDNSRGPSPLTRVAVIFPFDSTIFASSPNCALTARRARSRDG